jgi:ElaB/YqjD/DUF883 family membrane-anchored ribosome-binding protein
MAADAAKTAHEARTNGARDERMKDFALKAEKAVRDRAEDLRTRAQVYYDDAHDRFDTAQRYLVERVQEKPVVATLAAVGVGVVLGMLIAGGRRR